VNLQQQKERRIPISECFRSIQGEGALIGRPTIFIRVGGCDYRCRMCDTQYAVLPTYRADWGLLTIEEIFAEVQRLSDFCPMLCTLSGGNPAMYPLGTLIDLGHQHGYHFALETQGFVE
jgi:7-carboxy-7-deazaguanine synthase